MENSRHPADTAPQLLADMVENQQVLAADWKALPSGGRVYHIQTIAHGQEVLGWGESLLEALRDAQKKIDAKPVPAVFKIAE